MTRSHSPPKDNDAMSTPEQHPPKQDAFDRLVELNERLKEKQEAWRKLLESLEQMRQKPMENPETNKPSE
jgi:hypothetical protein